MCESTPRPPQAESPQSRGFPAYANALVQERRRLVGELSHAIAALCQSAGRPAPPHIDMRPIMRVVAQLNENNARLRAMAPATSTNLRHPTRSRT